MFLGSLDSHNLDPVELKDGNRSSSPIWEVDSGHSYLDSEGTNALGDSTALESGGFGGCEECG